MPHFQDAHEKGVGHQLFSHSCHVDLLKIPFSSWISLSRKEELTTLMNWNSHCTGPFSSRYLGKRTGGPVHLVTI